MWTYNSNSGGPYVHSAVTIKPKPKKPKPEPKPIVLPVLDVKGRPYAER